jgi:hypothetical protein
MFNRYGFLEKKEHPWNLDVDAYMKEMSKKQKKKNKKDSKKSKSDHDEEDDGENKLEFK